MPVGGGAFAVAYYKVANGRVVLLHTEVPQELSGAGHGVLEASPRDGKWFIAEVLLHALTRGPASGVPRPPGRLIEHRRDAHDVLRRQYCMTIECMTKRK